MLPLILYLQMLFYFMSGFSDIPGKKCRWVALGMWGEVG